MESPISRTELDRFREFVARGVGLQIDDNRIDGLVDVLRARVAATGTDSMVRYVATLESPDRARTELRAIAEALTVGETYFFRNPDQLRACVERVLPERIRARAGERRLRILSAGCASGEEPYSLAILLREHFPEIAAWDLRVVAIDVSPAALAKARSGTYSEWSLRQTSDAVRQKWFEPAGNSWVLAEQARSLVTFEERNLIDDDPAFWSPAAFDVVFCRNVTMYLTRDATLRAVRHVTHSLVPNGYLFLGHAESLRGLSNDFELCHTHETFYYARRTEDRDEKPAPAFHVASEPTVIQVAYDAASWVDAIQAASAKIAVLAERRPGADMFPIADSTETKSPVGLAVDRARASLRDERYADGLAHLGTLSADAATDADTLLLRAVLLVNAGSLDDAEKLSRDLLALDDLNAGAHYVAALCREHAGDREGAREHDRIAIHLDPRFGMPHLHLGLMARRSGDAETARHEIAEASALLEHEDPARILLFGGGFGREALLSLCRSELRACGATR